MLRSISLDYTSIITCDTETARLTKISHPEPLPDTIIDQSLSQETISFLIPTKSTQTCITHLQQSKNIRTLNIVVIKLHYYVLVYNHVPVFINMWFGKDNCLYIHCTHENHIITGQGKSLHLGQGVMGNSLKHNVYK